MATVQLENVTKRFGSTTALDDVSFTVSSGTLLTIIGPSGCGKSTLLRVICGLERADSGRILINDIDVSRRPPKDRGCAMVFQSYALYPHWTVRQNIGFPLRVRRRTSSDIAEQVNRIARDLGLTPKLDQRPRSLSGGERQRVALGRAMAADPQVFLFDEPLSNLDAPLRAGMRAEIVARQRGLAKTALYVTHDQTEALTMGDCVLVLDQGRMMGLGSPEALYCNPPNRFVASFLGRPPINRIRGRLIRTDDRLRFDPLGWDIPPGAAPSDRASGELELGIRPEHLHLTATGNASGWRVVAREFVGERTEYRVSDGTLTLAAVSDSGESVGIDATVSLRVQFDQALFFDPDSGDRLR
ncbi:MAG TPA: ABC transporter ATP-binding protein [candidate division Zixibacteria bacterium]|jgi:multiple sugar transport system ATP-binding protein